MTPAPVRVRLTPAEVITAAHIGAMITAQNIVRDLAPRGPDACDRRGKYGVENARNGWQLTMEGALGEAAVAKHLGIYWTGNVGNRGSRDVGPYEVRTTPLTPPTLRLNRGNRPHAIYILAHGFYGEYDLLGWTTGSDAMQARYWGDRYQNGRPAYWVPVEDLRDMRDLPDALAARGIEVAA